LHVGASPGVADRRDGFLGHGGSPGNATRPAMAWGVSGV
jgi:hypothetical protein